MYNTSFHQGVAADILQGQPRRETILIGKDMGPYQERLIQCLVFYHRAIGTKHRPTDKETFMRME